MVEALPASGGGHVLTFAYGQSYLGREGAPALYLPELPKRRGRQEPSPGLDVHGVIRDAVPDAWGQRVIMRRLLGRDGRDRDSADVPLLTYLLESGSNRPGALDFQGSASEHVDRTSAAPIVDLLGAADDLQSGAPIELQEALDAGSSVGGARPKANIVDGDRQLIAKFSAMSDTYPVMKAEAVAMDLGRCVGLDVAPAELIEVGGREVLLVERFDRGPGGARLMFVSALTMLGLHEMFVRRADTLRELFGRIVLNVLVGNTDDHARNHAAFWDGERLALTPAYDICPQLRTGQEQAQAIERDALWGRQILKPFANYGYPR
ncbi:MAG: HipA domain-containing protein [Acidimicrobiales bacterium]